jgi:hypothetical protein
MQRTLVRWACVVCCIGAACANAADTITTDSPPAAIPTGDLDKRAAALAKQVMDRPTVQANGPIEIFTCTPEQYYWLLDNPDRAVVAWRRLGAKCVSIQRRGPTSFGYVDDAGTNVTWEVVHKAPGIRIWFAEGKVKPSPVLPLVPVKALVMLRCTEGKTAEGALTVQHQSTVVVHTDSKAAAAVTKMMGQSAPKLAEQGLGQLQLFFSALSCYVGRHPERAEMLFGTETGTAPQVMPKNR